MEEGEGRSLVVQEYLTKYQTEHCSTVSNERNNIDNIDSIDKLRIIRIRLFFFLFFFVEYLVNI